jgi:hypothetical protein
MLKIFRKFIQGSNFMRLIFTTPCLLSGDKSFVTCFFKELVSWGPVHKGGLFYVYIGI